MVAAALTIYTARGECGGGMGVMVGEQKPGHVVRVSDRNRRMCGSAWWHERVPGVPNDAPVTVVPHDARVTRSVSSAAGRRAPRGTVATWRVHDVAWRRVAHRLAFFESERGRLSPRHAGDDAIGVRVGRRLYWLGNGRYDRREGTVVAVYAELRGPSDPAVLVMDIRWDAPAEGERPRGPLGVGIPVARMESVGWGWVDEPVGSQRGRRAPNAGADADGQLDWELRRRFGSAIRRLRKAQRLSQERLANVCGLHRTFVGAIERGESNVSLATLGRLAEGLAVSIATLAAEAERSGVRSLGSQQRDTLDPRC